MEKMYIAFQCKSCGKEFILLSQEAASTLKADKYLVCPHCSSRKIHVEGASDNVMECMQHNSFKRIKGKLRQVRSG